MVAVSQNVLSAELKVDGQTISQISKGMVVYLGVFEYDDFDSCDKLVNKIIKTRMFPDSNGKINLNILDAKGQIMVVSNFTLCADLNSGNRPSFTKSASREKAELMYQSFIKQLQLLGVPKVVSGVFGADMEVESLQKGPINIVFDTEHLK